jgi:hypothetical protein
VQTFGRGDTNADDPCVAGFIDLGDGGAYLGGTYINGGDSPVFHLSPPFIFAIFIPVITSLPITFANLLPSRLRGILFYNSEYDRCALPELAGFPVVAAASLAKKKSLSDDSSSSSWFMMRVAALNLALRLRGLAIISGREGVITFLVINRSRGV